MRYFDSTGPWLLGFAVASIVLHGAVDGAWGFHRDELLYLAMGDHPALGYWSNPPVIGFLGLIADIVPGTGIWTVRWIPALLGALLVVVTGLIAREIGGGLPGIIMACLCTLLSPALLRTGVLFQPVIVDVLIWTIILLLGLRHLNTSNERWLVAVGLVVGVGLMNKYSVAFLILGMVTGLLLTPHRRVFRTRAFYMGLAVASVVVLPNLIWQIAHGFPVIEHFGVLRSTQLVNVKPHDFILEQFLIHLPVVWVWVVGLVFLFRPVGRVYRVVGWTCVAVFFLLLVLGGKSYYTLGLYPALFAAGARWLELRAAIPSSWPLRLSRHPRRLHLPVLDTLFVSPRNGRVWTGICRSHGYRRPTSMGGRQGARSAAGLCRHAGMGGARRASDAGLSGGRRT